MGFVDKHDISSKGDVKVSTFYFCWQDIDSICLYLCGCLVDGFSFKDPPSGPNVFSAAAMLLR
jgi:hypothetical protein